MKLNRLIFTEANPRNEYVCWDIGKPPLSPRYSFEGMMEEQYRRIIQAKSRIDEAVYAAVREYVNDERLYNAAEGMFPRSDRLTGNFYIAEETYVLHGGDIRGSIMAHFTEMFSGGVVVTPAEQDYLGLEVRFVLSGNGDIVIEGIDSSSI